MAPFQNHPAALSPPEQNAAYASDIDAAIVAFVASRTPEPISFGILLWRLTRDLGSNQMNEEFLRRRLAKLRDQGTLVFQKRAPTGWVLNTAQQPPLR